MKKTLGKIFKLLLILCIVGGLAWGGYTYLSGRKADTEAQGPVYSRLRLTRGTLTQEVTGTGALALHDSEEIKAPVALTVEEIPVSAGDAVKAGDRLMSFDRDELYETLRSLRAGLSQIDSELQSLAARETDTESLTAGLSGRVKAVYAAAGEAVGEVMARDGALALLSLDEKMKLTVPAQEGARPGDEYSLLSGGYRYTGTVTGVSEGQMTLSFPDTRVLPGDRVQLLSGDAVLAEGLAEVSMPCLVTAYQGGLVDSVSAKVNATVTRATRLFELSHLENTEDYRLKLKERADRLEEIGKAQALYEDPALYAPRDGIVSLVSAQEGQSLEGEAPLLTLLALGSFEMNVTVDELDIGSVQPGQKARLVMDALPDAVYTAEVSRVSQLGESSGGITGYQVRLSVSGDERLKVGMNGTATIVTGEERDALLLPLTALQSDKQGSYVWLYREGAQGTQEAPGVKTYVRTGLSDADFAVVTEGLSEGDEVLAVRSAVSEGTGFGFGMPGSMSMPADGGFQRRTQQAPRQGGGAPND